MWSTCGAMFEADSGKMAREKFHLSAPASPLSRRTIDANVKRERERGADPGHLHDAPDEEAVFPGVRIVVKAEQENAVG